LCDVGTRIAHFEHLAAVSVTRRRCGSKDLLGEKASTNPAHSRDMVTVCADNNRTIKHIADRVFYKWRTAQGIAKETGLNIRRVVDFLEKSDDVIRSKKPNERGKRYQREAPFVKRLISAITNSSE
jgi:hypothetical protein